MLFLSRAGHRHAPARRRTYPVIGAHYDIDEDIISRHYMLTTASIRFDTRLSPLSKFL